jgi:hypothetical protein
MISSEGRGEPDVVIHLDVEGGAERVRKGGMRVVKVAEVKRIKRGTGGEKSRGKGKESLGSVADERGVGMAVTADKISAVDSGGNNGVRPTAAIREFSNSASGSIR